LLITVIPMADEADLVDNVAKAADSVAKVLTDAPLPEQVAPTAGVTAEMPRNLDFLLDVTLQVSVEVGRTRMTVQDLLQLGQGSVVELSKLAGEPLDIFINERLVARGEAVIVNEKFGVRITDIISQQERVNSLG